MKVLWRRLEFNILISNTDDRLRNHGFLYAGEAC
jgi:serine/threonine-protein kinase HipA